MILYRTDYTVLQAAWLTPNFTEKKKAPTKRTSRKT